MRTKQNRHTASADALSNANRELDPPWFPPDLTSYPPRDCASALNCSDRTIRRLIQAGELEAFRIGGRGIRITESSIRKYIVSRRFFGNDK